MDAVEGPAERVGRVQCERFALGDLAESRKRAERLRREERCPFPGCDAQVNPDGRALGMSPLTRSEVVIHGVEANQRTYFCQ